MHSGGHTVLRSVSCCFAFQDKTCNLLNKIVNISPRIRIKYYTSGFRVKLNPRSARSLIAHYDNRTCSSLYSGNICAHAWWGRWINATVTGDVAPQPANSRALYNPRDLISWTVQLTDSLGTSRPAYSFVRACRFRGRRPLIPRHGGRSDDSDHWYKREQQSVDHASFSHLLRTERIQDTS